MKNTYWENTILISILISSILLAFDNPLDDPNSEKAKILGYIDYFFTFLFSIEMLVKIISLSFIFDFP